MYRERDIKFNEQCTNIYTPEIKRMTGPWQVLLMLNSYTTCHVSEFIATFRGCFHMTVYGYLSLMVLEIKAKFDML